MRASVRSLSVTSANPPAASRRIVVGVVACLALAVAAPAVEASRGTPTRCRDLFRRDTPPIPTGTMPISEMVVADFNGDRRDDIAHHTAFAPDWNKITVLLSRADGTFASRVARIRTPVWHLVAGDLDGDGRQDIVTTSINEGAVTVLLGDGAGGFTERAGPQLRPSSTVRAIVQIDGDARPDVLALTGDGPTPSLQVLRGDGTGALIPSEPQLDLPGFRWGLAVSDFDGDSRSDVVLDQTSTGWLTVAFGNGTGGFSTPAPAMEWNLGLDQFAISDFDRDGSLDLGISPIGGTMALAGDGTGRFTPFSASRGIPVIGLRGPIAADFDGDGNPDLATTSSGSDGEIYVWIGDGRGRFRAADGSPEWGGRYPAASAVTGDFNADGRPDLVGAAGGSERVLRVHLNTGGRVGRGTGQSIRWIQASPRILQRGASVALAARLRCHPGELVLYRRPVRHTRRSGWRRLATVETNHRGIALYSDTPRFSAEYQWRAVGAARRTVKPTRRRTIVVTASTRRATPSRR